MTNAPRESVNRLHDFGLHHSVRRRNRLFMTGGGAFFEACGMDVPAAVKTVYRLAQAGPAVVGSDTGRRGVR
jgi:hypothetical protein